MKAVALFALFAPIRLCTFGGGGGDIIWDEGPFGVDPQLTNPTADSSWCVGDTMGLLGQADAERVSEFELQGLFSVGDTEVCAGWLDDRISGLTCEYVLQRQDVGSPVVVFDVFSPNGEVITTGHSITVSNCPDIDDDTENEAPEPAALAITSPQMSSVWDEADPIPFVATVHRDVPVVNARVVWEIDGQQQAALTARTDDQGNAVSLSWVEPGPHEAVAITIVDDERLEQRTRFVVQSDDWDGDTDLDSDTAAL